LEGSNPRWTCRLRAELGSWEAVYKDEEYRKKIKPVWERLKIKDCGDYECENCLSNGNT